MLRFLLSLLADIGKTTRTTSTTYNYASPGQHAMRDTSLLKGKQQRTTFAGSIFRKSCQSLLSLLADIGKTT